LDSLVEMRKKSELTRRRIIEAAYFLFYRKGFTRVSMDEIAARARITKRTLYLYFRSKDDLLAYTLLHYSELDRKRLQVIADRLPSQTDRMLDSFFGQLLEWASKPRWAGSGFTRLVAELADLPGHPARAIARRAKAVTEAWLAELLAQGRVPVPLERAREVMLLMEGAMSLMLIHGDRKYGEAALKAAKRMIKC
jgi:AcrR family transcriptional regulator